MTRPSVNIDAEGAEVDFTVAADIVTDAGQEPRDIHGLAHRLIATYAGPLAIGGACWNVIEAQGEEFLLIVPIPLDVLNDYDSENMQDLDYSFLVLQWYKRRSRMQQMLAIGDHDTIDVLAVCGLADAGEAENAAAMHNQAFWQEVLRALIDYYECFPINTHPRLGDCCPDCDGHGKRYMDEQGNNLRRPAKCITCLGSGALPTLQELRQALEACYVK